MDESPWTVTVCDPTFLSEGMRLTIWREGEKVTVILGRQIGECCFEIAGKVIKRSWFERLFSFPWTPWKSERFEWMGSD